MGGHGARLGGGTERETHMKKLGMAAACALAALTIAACGGEDEDDGGEDAATDYVTVANEACRDSAVGVRDVNLEMGIDFTPKEGAEKIEAQIPVREQALATFEGLEPPAEAASDWDAFVAAYGDVIAANEAQVKALSSGDQTKIDAANAAAGEANEKRQRAAEQAGLDVCASVLPADQGEAAIETIREFETTADPATSCEYENPEALTTEAYVEDALGGIEKCTKMQSAPNNKVAQDIRVEGEPTGVADLTASVTYENEGGTYDGELVRAGLYYLDGSWRIYMIEPIS